MHRSILYAGYQYDAETGIYYLNARMYDPVIARFLQEDTYRGDTKDPLSLNLYVYCKSNPIIYYDPSGHIFLTGFTAIKVTNEMFGNMISNLSTTYALYTVMHDVLLPTYC